MKLPFGLLENDLAIDLGTANTLIYQRGRGIVCNEPSVVAIQTTKNGSARPKIIAIGREAKSMLGRTPASISAVRPVRDGVIADYEVTEAMLKHLMKKVRSGSRFVKPRIIICVPHGITEVEKRAVRDSAESAGAREVFLIEEPVAAAIGAGLPIAEPCGNMILDIGGGTTEIAVLSLKGVVYSQSIRVAGDRMDEAISNYVRRRHNVLIGERTAEQLKISIGSALATGEDIAAEVRGRDLVNGVPKSVVITEDEVREALSEPINQILEMIRTSLEKTPPELAADIVDRGIVMTGGGAMLRHLDLLIAQKTGLPVTLADDPMSAVVKGSGAVLDQLEEMRDVILQ